MHISVLSCWTFNPCWIPTDGKSPYFAGFHLANSCHICLSSRIEEIVLTAVSALTSEFSSLIIQDFPTLPNFTVLCTHFTELWLARSQWSQEMLGSSWSWLKPEYCSKGVWCCGKDRRSKKAADPEDDLQAKGPWFCLCAASQDTCAPVPSCQAGFWGEGRWVLSKVLLTLMEQLLGLHCPKADLERSNVRHGRAVSGESWRRRSHTGFASGKRELKSLAHEMS